MSAQLPDHHEYYADFQASARQLPGRRAPWVGQLREAALEAFMASGFPTTRQEAWKYTDVRPISKRHFRLAPDDARVQETALAPYVLGAPAAFRLVFVNGHFAPRLSRLDRLPPGITLSSLAVALEREPAMLEAYLGHYINGEGQGFAALNTAFMNDGAYLRLGHGVVLEDPIELLFLSSGPAETVSHLRNLIVADEHSRATLVESYVGLEDGVYFSNAVTEVMLGPGAVLEHYKIEQESNQGFHVAGLHVHQNRDSRYTSHHVSLGGRLVRNDLHTVLDGEGADCTLNGLYLTRDRQLVDNHTRIDHRRPHGTSREWYKGVLTGHSRGVFSGRVVVHPDAQKTDAQQANNNLLLSEDAEVDSLPQLEIYADDVKCSHGSTVGALDEDALFYLRTRAIDEMRARNILVYGFASDVLLRMGLTPLRVQLEQRLTGRLVSPEAGPLGGHALEGLL